MRDNKQEEEPWTLSRTKRKTSSPTSVAASKATGSDDPHNNGYDDDQVGLVEASGAAAGVTGKKKKKKRKRKKKKKHPENGDMKPDDAASVKQDEVDIQKQAEGAAEEDASRPLPEVYRDNELKEIETESCVAAALPDDDNKDTAPAPPLSKLVGLFRPEWPICCFAVILMLLTELMNVVNPAMLAKAYELLTDPNSGITHDERMAKINNTIVLVMIIHVAGNFCAWLRFSIVGVVSERVVTRLRVRLYANLLHQEISFFDANNSGDLGGHLAMDTGLIQEAMATALPEVVVGSIKLIATSVAMLWLSPHLALVTVGCVGFSIAVSSVFGTWMGEWTKKYFSVYGVAQSHCYEALGSMRMVQSFAAEGKEEVRFRQLMGEPNTWWPSRKKGETTYSLGISKSFVNASFFTFIFFSGFGSIYMSIWYVFISSQLVLSMLFGEEY